MKQGLLSNEQHVSFNPSTVTSPTLSDYGPPSHAAASGAVSHYDDESHISAQPQSSLLGGDGDSEMKTQSPMRSSHYTTRNNSSSPTSVPSSASRPSASHASLNSVHSSRPHTRESMSNTGSGIDVNLNLSHLKSSQLFDELEFLHDFLEAEAQQPWFESNCFHCNCKNLFFLFIFLCILCGVTYVSYYLWWDSYIHEHLFYVLRLASIPVICILFTYFHIALALWMTFWPTEFFGLFQFQTGPLKGYGLGWQGIVPMKAVKMANIAVDLMVPDVIKMEDVVSRIDPKIVSDIMEPACLKVLQSIIPKVALAQAPMAYALLPENIKKMLVDVAMQEAPITTKNMIRDMTENIETIFDLKGMVSNALMSDKALLNKVFLKCGRKELIFIRNFGAALGLVFGLLQMVATIVFGDNKWFNMLLLPISGFVLGWITNWIALLMIFKPVQPIILRPFCCCGCNCNCVIQGLFLKRQKEVSVEFAAFLSKTVLRADRILAELYRGPSSNRVFETVTKHLKEACDRFAGYGRTKQLIEFAIGSERFEEVKGQVIDEMLHFHELDCMEEIVKVQNKLEEYADDVMDMERLLRVKMAALPVEQFEGVLHPIFEEDEIKLIIIGAILGLLVGVFQVTVIGN